jgi:S1-C subfamily serine protease
MSRIRFIILPSVVLLGAAGAMPAAAQQRVEVRVRSPQATTESDSPLRRLQRQLDSITHRYNEGEELTATDRRRMEVEISRLVDQLMGDAMRGSRVMLRQVPPVVLSSMPLVMPRGWIGIVAEGVGMVPRVENGEVVVRYVSYPRIVSIDPSSPAQAAGIVPNDTLIAYDGRDIRENDINLNRLLRPNAKVSVRVRRDGRTREVPVVVAEAPSRVVQRRGDEARDDRSLFITQLPDGQRFPPIIVEPQGGGRGSVRVGTLMPSVAMPRMLFGMGSTGVAGALLVTISEGLGKKLGSTGVLVASAPMGSPASESGLEDGDIITKVGEVAVRNALDVQRAVGLANENGQKSVEIVLVRDKATLTKTLRW